MVDTAYIVKSTPHRAFIGSFQHFAYIYFSLYFKLQGVSCKSYLLPSFIFLRKRKTTWAFVPISLTILFQETCLCSIVQDQVLQYVCSQWFLQRYIPLAREFPPDATIPAGETLYVPCVTQGCGETGRRAEHGSFRPTGRWPSLQC